MTLAIVFPGQGSQAIGMMDGFAAHPIVRETFAEPGSLAARDGDVVHLGWLHPYPAAARDRDRTDPRHPGSQAPRVVGVRR